MSTAVSRVLVVDDDRLVLVTLCAGLRQAGIEVIEADHGDDAILLARQHRPQLAILDLRMQGKSGMEVARYLASLTPPIDFLFLGLLGLVWVDFHDFRWPGAWKSAL